MRPHLPLTIILATCVVALAHASSGSFGVSVQVIDRRSAPALLDAIPVPPQARLFDAGDSGRSYAWSGTPEEAAAFFDLEMPRRGYRALRQDAPGDAVEQVWAGKQGRVLLQLRRAIGSVPVTRIRIHAAAVARRPDSPERNLADAGAR